MKPTRQLSTLSHLMDGILLEIFFPEGSEVPVLSNVAVIGKSGEATGSFNQDPSEVSAPAATVSASGICQNCCY